MAHYIIWKNVKSDSINGLLICELPPIIKPKIRTEITEIEGKDRDIIDKVGYQAYDKTAKIGALGNCNIDQLIKFFSGKGEVTFSNEPDKIYIAEIIDQIEFQRMTRFKIADVKFHVQPFKYLRDEQIVDITITDQTNISVINQGLEPSKPIITLHGNVIWLK